MTKKDFELIAAAMQEARTQAKLNASPLPVSSAVDNALDETAFILAEHMARTNVRFDSDRFLRYSFGGLAVSNRTELNRDWRKRDALVFGTENVRERYDIQHFDDMDPETLRQLVADGFADADDQQNAAPSIGEFLAAAERHPQMRFTGYVVSPNRQDYRVSVEGFLAPFSVDIVNEFHRADEFTVNPDNTVRAWWD